VVLPVAPLRYLVRYPEETKEKKTEGEEAPKRINLRAKPADENEDEKAEG
jgi:hypothetical protein